MEKIGLWEVLTSVAIPLLIAALGLLRAQITDLQKRLGAAEEDAAALRQKFADGALAAEQRYINWKHMDDLKVDIFKRFDRLEKALNRIQPGGVHGEP